MKMKVDDILTYIDSRISPRYGTGVVTSISADEYTILWSGRGLTKYRRSVIDGKLEQIFQRADKQGGLPKERHLHLGASKVGVPFNVNFDREKVKQSCETLILSEVRKAKEVADGLTSELFAKKLALRGPAKTVLWQLAELCSSRKSAACDEARNISKELFFGYVLQKSDFDES